MTAITYPARARRELARLLGAAEAARALAAANALVPALLARCDDRGSRAVRTHLRTAIVPVAALYTVLRERLGMQRALEVTFEVMRAMFVAMPRAVRALRFLPARFSLFRSANRFALRTQFPPEGWACEIVDDSRSRFAYTMRSCCYLDAYIALGVPEVAPLSCRMDEVAYAALPADITFERTRTLAGGDDCCDFVHRNLTAGRR